jgi:outer membrane protein assembly factor BamE (lipoprotein component of BamABCDE complex)
MEEPLTGHSGQVPFCQTASERILSAVNPGMTQEQVLEIVGKPLEKSGLYGTDWHYSRYSSPSVEFGYVNRRASTVQGYDGDSSSVTVNFAYENAAISMVEGYSAHGHASCQ